MPLTRVWGCLGEDLTGSYTDQGGGGGKGTVPKGTI